MVSEHASRCSAISRALGHSSLAAVLVCIHVSLLAWNARRQSPTIDEPAHLVAGISYWKTGRFDLYAVNPPLVRLVAALPVLGMSPRLDRLDFTARPDDRPEFALGRAFIQHNGERAFSMFTRARLACIPFSVLGAAVCYLWSARLAGRTAGLLSLALWCFFPETLAHGCLITADAPAAATGILAGFLFWRWLHNQNWKSAALSGIACGLAILTKTTSLTLLALWPVLWLAWCARRRPAPSRQWLTALRQLAVSLGIALFVVNAGYLFQGSLTPLGEFDFLSTSFTGNSEASPLIRVPGNRFQQTWLAAVPVPFPAPLVQGLDLQSRDFENYMPLYLGGRWLAGGCWYAYFYIALVKWPLGFWLLLWLRVIGAWKAPRVQDSIVLLAPPACLLALASLVATPGYARYILPALPFLFVWCAQLGAARLNSVVIRLTAWCACAWLIVSSLSIYPHSLAYFNEFAGGPRNGSAHLIDCNIDWGQDLFELARWQELHPDASPFFVAYHGQVNPRLRGIAFRSPRPDTETPEGVPTWAPGYYAISVHILRGGLAFMYDDEGRFLPRQRPELSRFQFEEPVDKVGYSLFVYRMGAGRSERDNSF